MNSPSPVGGWQLALSLEADSDAPVFLQLARALTDAIQCGRLRPGARLPGSRTLAADLRVHRNTVVAAYRELYAEGWLTASEARGTFVSTELPDKPAKRLRGRTERAAVPSRLGFELHPGPSPDRYVEPPAATMMLTGGVPDVRLVPIRELSRAYRRALARHTHALLQYGAPQGLRRLRQALADMLSATRGVPAGPEEVMVVRGSQMALDLVARALVKPGDAVAVESLGYRSAWEAFRHAGADVLPVPVDAHGLRVDALATLATKRPLRAIYVTPHHQYPTTVTLTAGRRLALLQLAQRHRFAIIEDDYDHEFHYEGRPVFPLASSDRAGVVVYVGTLSKILAPGVRIGYVVAPRPLIDRLSEWRRYVDGQGDHAVESAVAELLEDGEVERHARRVKRVYQTRRDVLMEAIERHLQDTLDVSVPAGGMALWARVAEHVDVDAWAARSFAAGVLFHPGRRFAFDGRARPFARLGFAALDEAELREAVRRLQLSAKAARR